MLSFFKQLGFDKEENTTGGKRISLPILIVLAILGVALLIFGGFESKETPKDTTAKSTATDELSLYQAELEEKIRTLCASVEGVSDVTAVVTLAGGFSSEYATEWRDGNEEYVILGSGSTASGLLIGHHAPEIAGIGIVCRGGDDARVQRELTALLSAAFDLPSNRIYVTAAKK